MKKLIVLVFLLLGTVAWAQAQRYAVIDSRYILEHMPAYEEAQNKLDAIAEEWQKEIDAKFEEVDNLYRDYSAEKVMLSEDLKKKREDEIMAKEKEAQDLQKQRFGYEGDLFKKREELIKPIQDKVYSAAERLATEKRYDLIMDKSAGVTVFYATPELNKSDEVLKLLNINN